MAAVAHHGPAVRVALPHDIADAGALTAEAYLADGLLDPGDAYEAELRDAARRAREAILLVATVPMPLGGADVVVGSLTLAPYGSSYAEVAGPGEVELRMLAVAPEVRGQGIAEMLMLAALREAVGSGADRVVLSTLDSMTAAHRLYDRLGFASAPERDWGHEGVHLRVRTWQPPSAPGVLVEAATWRPLRTVDVEGWRLGLSDGMTRRANSVLPLGVPADVEAAVTAVETTYAQAQLPAVFRVCRAARPSGLDALLERRGYATVARTDVLVRDLGRSAGVTPRQAIGPGASGGGPVRVLTAAEPDDTWLSTWLGVKGQADTAVARGVLEGSPALYLTAVEDGVPLATLRAAFAEDWVGLSCLVVVPQARRRGLARVLTQQALARAEERGARRAFLQVEVANSAAARLYADLGFRPAERYHYRELAG
ncbi:GNAT family N-acetyltransferase [Cellulomonas soli]|uniref:GNAT family N-acetyltransferase n=1 Tax=Cellulomonas soli TaxID=931535 RepID=UPI003F84FC96